MRDAILNRVSTRTFVDEALTKEQIAQRIAKEEWQPDKAYTLDVCKSNGEYFMLEANSFSCSGLYKCPPEPIVKSVSEAALKEWKEYNANLSI